MVPRSAPRRTTPKADRRKLRPRVDPLESRELLAAAPSMPLAVGLAPGSAVGRPADGVTDRSMVVIRGRTMPGRTVAMDADMDGRFDRFVRSDRQGHFRIRARIDEGMVERAFAVRGMRRGERVVLSIVHAEPAAGRPFDGSPTPAGRPFTRIVPDSVAYAPGLPPRPDARTLSASMAEDPAHPSLSQDIELGLVFFGQFVDHDITLNDSVGQGPSVDPAAPINLRTPALDLDPVYMGGPHGSPQIYTADGLSFRLGKDGTDLLRDGDGIALIGDARNDDNAMTAEIHLAFQKFHNTLMARALGPVDPATLTQAQRDALFDMVRARVIGTYQGIVANQFAEAITGRPIDDRSVPPVANIPIEFSGAAFRVGHTLVPDMIVVDDRGTRRPPTDPALRGGTNVPYHLLFGPDAQRAAGFDDKLSDAMRTLLIPLSPNDPGAGDMIGGDAPNIGGGQIFDGVMHLDLAETNILRGRELRLPSGEEYLARLEHRPYDPARDGNTDLFVYVLREAAPLGHLGKVGTDIIRRGLGGTLAADRDRYDNPAVWSRAQIRAFRGATFEGLLRQIGTPGF